MSSLFYFEMVFLNKTNDHSWNPSYTFRIIEQFWYVENQKDDSHITNVQSAIISSRSPPIKSSYPMDKTFNNVFDLSVNLINIYGVYIILICEMPHSEITRIHFYAETKCK